MPLTKEEAIRYNVESAAKRGWLPEWLGLECFNDELITKIIEFQKEFDLEEDGLVGPATFRRLYTYHHSQNDENENGSFASKEKASIRYKNKDYPILWSKVVLWDEPGGLKCRSKPSQRAPKYFVTHWDVCLSSASCAKVLARRKPQLGVHFCIDNDGTIFQLAPIENICYHAKGHNGKSLGVEVSNAVSLKYQSHYKKRFGARPVISDGHAHRKSLKPYLGFYPHQIQALAALWAAVSLATGIPLQVPYKNNEVDHHCASGNFSGFCGHLHLTRRKWDPAGLDFHQVAEMAIMIKLQMES